MKLTIIIPVLTLAAGLVIGWLAKPGQDKAEEQAPEAKTANMPSRSKPKPSPPAIEKSKRKSSSSVQIITPNSSEGMSESQKAQIEKYKSQFGDMLKKNQQRKLNARISKLVAQLNLTPEQEAELRKNLKDDQFDPASIMSGNINPSDLSKFSDSNSVLDEALADILSDEQKEAYEALKKRELANEIESKALKRLSRLGGLDMTPEQKEAVYDILYKQAEESTNNKSSSNNVITTVTGGMGLNIDPEDLGIDLSGLGELPSNGEALTQEDIMARIRQNQQRKIDEKVEALRPVLNEDQLKQYRESLEIPQGGVIGGFMGGLGNGESGDR